MSMANCWGRFLDLKKQLESLASYTYSSIRLRLLLFLGLAQTGSPNFHVLIGQLVDDTPKAIWTLLGVLRQSLLHEAMQFAEHALVTCKVFKVIP